MKNKFFAVLLIFSTALLNHAVAQEAKIINAPGKPYDKNGEATCGKALQNFELEFKHIADAVWSTTTDGACIASFGNDSVKTMVAYNEKGIWHHTIRSYHEQQLPYHVQAQIKRDYPACSIGAVQEINLDEQTVYFIYVAGKKDFKLIKIGETETEEIQTFAR